ncbi:MAG: zinc dependent phospholipase C family protein [Chloroflexi bacterium]|nr:zinc dependent phospholipase C family protein [Chloroflexota bacterium]
MPNSQTHLASTHQIATDSRVVERLPLLADPAARAAFYLGAISPDVRIVSRQSRVATHFFDIPNQSGVQAQDEMLRQWPNLRELADSEPIRAAFVAGYITHLVMDQVWLDDIVMPSLFINGQRWGTSHPNWRLYSILMTYLEYRADRLVPDHVIDAMAGAQPDHWLPFVDDAYLEAWRDGCAQRIRTGGPQGVSTMFAASNDMTPMELEEIVQSEEVMAEVAYPIVERQRLIDFERLATDRSRDAVLAYLNANA